MECLCILVMWKISNRRTDVWISLQHLYTRARNAKDIDFARDERRGWLPTLSCANLRLVSPAQRHEQTTFHLVPILSVAQLGPTGEADELNRSVGK